MARKRYITSDISIDHKIAKVVEENPIAGLMWPWLIPAFDDWGRMTGDPMEIKLTVFPAFPFKSQDIADAIALLDKHGVVHLYEVDGKPYLAINPETFYKYQTYIQAERRKNDASKYPAPPNPPWKDKNSANFAENQQELPNIVLSHSHSLSHTHSHSMGDIECASTDEANDADDSGNQDSGRNEYPEEFEQFWAYYPRKLRKKAAYNCWKKAQKKSRDNKNPASAADLLMAAKNYAQACAENGTEMRYIQHPTTFLSLKNRPWEDFVHGIPDAARAGKSRASPTSNLRETPIDRRLRELGVFG